MTVRQIVTAARKGNIQGLTLGQLQIAALKAFPSSLYQKVVRAEINRRLDAGEKVTIPVRYE